MNKITKIVLFTIIVVFILGMALYPTISKKFSKDEESQAIAVPAPSRSSGSRGAPLNVTMKIASPEVLTEKLIITGHSQPDEEASLVFETSGKITDVFFQEGSFVKKGTLLAKVNDKPLQAELQKLEAQIPLAEDRVYRQNALLEKDAVSKEAYEQVTTELEKLQADIALVKARIAQTELRAPFDGMIGLRQVSEGNYASPTTVIATITKTSPLKIEFSVNERYVNYIKPGTPISFRTDISADQEFLNAKVYAVESRIDLKTKTKKVRALYPNTKGLLNPGGSVYIEVNVNEVKDAITVPNEAIIAEMGRDIVYIYSNGKAKLVEVTKGLRTEANIQVLSGIQIGDTIITSGVMQLRDGLSVNILNN
ncbi:membrane fusion protein (multidrug efflux system) [Dysgonomonadaceae bacterium PH5-43]|nr:membrane fusion protein (multidrug efflux system) [Dysgonomonadaceae bacterium PH5-43]